MKLNVSSVQQIPYLSCNIPTIEDNMYEESYITQIQLYFLTFLFMCHHK